MTDIFLAQVLILSLHILVLIRPFSKHISQSQYKNDVLAIIPFVTSLILLLSIFAFSLQFVFVLLLLLNFFTCALNLPRAYSFLSGMRKDFFSTSFKALSAILLVFSLLLFGLFSIYRPRVSPLSENLITKKYYYGSHQAGFFEHKGIFDSYKAEKILFFPNEDALSSKESATILAIPDFGFDLEDMFESSKILSQKGYTLILFNFFATDSKLFPSISQIKTIKNLFEKAFFVFSSSEKIKDNKNDFIERKKQELLSAMSILYSENPRTFFIIAEGFVFEAAKELQKEFPFVIEGVYSNEKKAFFENEKSFGFARFSKTKPLDARILGIKDEIPAEKYVQNIDDFIQKTQAEKAIQKEEEKDDIN